MLEDLPPILRWDPDIRAVIYADAKETERQEQTIDALIREFFPATMTWVGFGLDERLLRLPPIGTDGQRRDAITAARRRLGRLRGGLDWKDAVTLIVGSTSWSYAEHDPADPTSPDPGVIRIFLPFDPADYDYLRVETLIRVQSPAGWDFVVSPDEGFVLGGGLLGESPLG